jgi:hypothetical protein
MVELAVSHFLLYVFHIEVLELRRNLNHIRLEAINYFKLIDKGVLLVVLVLFSVLS